MKSLSDVQFGPARTPTERQALRWFNHLQELLATSTVDLMVRGEAAPAEALVELLDDAEGYLRHLPKDQRPRAVETIEFGRSHVEALRRVRAAGGRSLHIGGVPSYLEH